MREMIDATAHEATMAAVARGEQEMLAAEETVAAPTPLAFWRVRRGLTKSNRARPPASRKAISRTSKPGAEKAMPPFSSASPKPCVYAWRISWPRKF